MICKPVKLYSLKPEKQVLPVQPYRIMACLAQWFLLKWVYDLNSESVFSKAAVHSFKAVKRTIQEVTINYPGNNSGDCGRTDQTLLSSSSTQFFLNLGKFSASAT